MRLTVVGLPYYNYSKLKNTLVKGQALSLEHDVGNAQSSTAVLVKFGSVKIGYIAGRKSEQALALVKQNLLLYKRSTIVTITEVRGSCLIVENGEDLIVGTTTGRVSMAADEYDPDNESKLPDSAYYVGAHAAMKALHDKDYFNKIFKEEKSMFDKIVNTNVAMANSAAFLEAGRIANNTAAKFVASKAPLMVKGYVDTAVGKLIIANAAAVAVEKFRPADKKLACLANAMITEAYQEVYRIVDIEKMLNEMLTSESVKAALAKL